MQEAIPHIKIKEKIHMNMCSKMLSKTYQLKGVAEKKTFFANKKNGETKIFNFDIFL